MSIEFAKSLWIYQRERFPIFENSLLVAALVASAVLYSCALRQGVLPPVWQIALGAVSVLMTFLLMRFFDEFKDAGDDARYRPYRAVPRGLVTLRQIGWLAQVVIVVQFTINVFWLDGLLPYLLLIDLWLALMTFEFGVPAWLKAHPLTYMTSHMLILPLIGLYAAAIDWWPQGTPPAGIGWYLAMLFAAGCVAELGRKLRTAEFEEEGVETWSSLYGFRAAFTAWICLIVTSGAVVMVLLGGAPLSIWFAVLILVVLVTALVELYRAGRTGTDGTLLKFLSEAYVLLTFITIAGASL